MRQRETTKGTTMTKATTTVIDLGNNEQISRGITKLADKRYLAVTFTQSKEFKTRRGAEKWLERKISR